jgi:hypothetical protein
MELTLAEQSVINYALSMLRDNIGTTSITDEFINGFILKIWSK